LNVVALELNLLEVFDRQKLFHEESQELDLLRFIT